MQILEANECLANDARDVSVLDLFIALQYELHHGHVKIIDAAFLEDEERNTKRTHVKVNVVRIGTRCEPLAPPSYISVWPI